MWPNKYKVITLGIVLGDEGKHLSAEEIAEFLSIGVRTAYRYIAALREDFDAPIVLIRENSGNSYACSHPWSMIETLRA